jgi:NNP family nitrate/nitrite transporter-like MFS transporter
MMMLGTIGVIYFLGNKDRAWRVLGFLRLLHAAVLRERRRQRIHLPDDPRDHAQGSCAADAAASLGPEQLKQAEKESAAITGFTSAIAAYGAFFIPKSFGFSIAETGSATGALDRLPRLLRLVPGHHLVRLCASGWACCLMSRTNAAAANAAKIAAK